MDRSAFVGVGYSIALRTCSQSWSGGPLRVLGAHPSAPAPSRPLIRPPVCAASSAAPPGSGRGKRGKSRQSTTGPYSDTVNLPQTPFSQRANAVKREPELQEMWRARRVYERLSRENGGEKFVLHDGPPFANGPIHCGHAMNKSLKDFIVKYQLMRGRRAAFVPGWDTHGLPIELKVLQGMKAKERRAASVLDLRERAKKFALEAVREQAEEMKRIGVWGDWDDPYLTLKPEFEAAQIGVFGDMYLKGHIYRGRKPVHWSPSSRTALAEAELEYPEGHKSTSCYCAFTALSAPNTAPDALKQGVADGHVGLCIWTTTPWTLPANRAVAVNTKLSYALVAGLHPRNPEMLVIVAKDLVQAVTDKMTRAAQTVAEISNNSDAGNGDDGNFQGATGERTILKPKIVAIMLGRDLVGMEYSHPLEEGLICRVVEGGDYITTETGTGLVHTAPGHGQEDYQTGLKEGLDIVSPVDNAGRFTEEAANGQFTGLSVLGDGNVAVLDKLAEAAILLLQESYAHKYPYDWRTKKPTIFRATEQWFASIDGFREEALNAIEDVQWFPAVGIKRIRGMVEGRGDWCLSRQRTWGVPIPVFYDDETGEAIMTRETIEHIQAVFAERGSNAWWELGNDDLLPEAYRGRNLRKGLDTMDVWFDSGTSWAAVAAARNSLAYPADVYLEGSDQHRGWFQSSLLTSIATHGKAPYKAVVTHGFLLDEKGVKMSKSIGNVVDPQQVINGGNNPKTEPPYGADVLRLWVASVDYTGDVMIGPQILRQISDVYRKLRNTMRYMAGNLHDYKPEEHAVRFEQLPSMDQFILCRMQEVIREVEAAYESYSFYRVFQALQRFAIVDMSNFYLDIAKDRLYIPEPDAVRRRTCQTVIADILEAYTRLMAPILPHMAEDMWQSLPYRPKSNNPEFPEAVSVFEGGWVMDGEQVEMAAGVHNAWNAVLDVRDAVNKVLEAARVDKTLGASMEAVVTLYVTDPAEEAVVLDVERRGNDVDELKRALIVSDVRMVNSVELVKCCAHHNVEGDDEDSLPRFAVGVDKSTAPKCDRCWHYDESVGVSSAHPLLCGRCEDAVMKMGILTTPQVAAEVA